MHLGGGYLSWNTIANVFNVSFRTNFQQDSGHYSLTPLQFWLQPLDTCTSSEHIQVV